MRIQIDVEAESIQQRIENALSQVSPKRRQYVQNVIQRLIPKIMERTPVETGRARSGWNAENSTREEENDESISEISVTNHVEYIPYLEYGTSRMEGQAMVRSSLEQIRSELSSIPLNLFE